MAKNLTRSIRSRQYVFGLVLPILLIILILVADILEGPKTSYVGVLAAVPPLASAFGSVRMVVAVSISAFAVAFAIGYLASDGNVAAQNTRLFIIAVVSIGSVALTAVRISNQNDLLNLAQDLAAANALSDQAYKDFLTGLPNRFGILHRLKNYHHPVRSVVMIDLDNFKTINDGYGHNVGDEYIKAVGGRISSGLKSEDVFGRWGGDEFVAVLPHNEEQSAEILERVIAQATQTPFQIAETEIPIKFSAGVAPWEPTATFEAVLQDADKALYAAKSRGGCVAIRFAVLSELRTNSKHEN